MMFKKRTRNSIKTAPTTISARSKPITIEDLSKQLVPITGRSCFAIVLHDLLAPDECANLIRRAEDEGFDDAMIQDGQGRQVLQRDVRNCGRCIVDDSALADAIYGRICGALRGRKDLEKKMMHAPWVTSRDSKSRSGSSLSSSTNSGGGGGGGESSSRKNGPAARAQDEEQSVITSVGLNERMRFLKYKPGHFFAPHRDLRYVRGPDAGGRMGETSHITVQLYLNDKFKGGTTRFLSGARHHDVVPRAGSALIFDHDILHEGSKVMGGVKYSVRTDVMFTPLQRQQGQNARMVSSSSSASSSHASPRQMTDRDPLGILASTLN